MIAAPLYWLMNAFARVGANLAVSVVAIPWSAFEASCGCVRLHSPRPHLRPHHHCEQLPIPNLHWRNRFVIHRHWVPRQHCLPSCRLWVLRQGRLPADPVSFSLGERGTLTFPDAFRFEVRLAGARLLGSSLLSGFVGEGLPCSSWAGAARSAGSSATKVNIRFSHRA